MAIHFETLVGGVTLDFNNTIWKNISNNKKAMHSKLVKLWKRKQEYNASTLKNYKCDAHSS